MRNIVGVITALIMSFGASGCDLQYDFSQVPENSRFEVHYIDVGQADAALVECDGESMLIDGGNVADSSLIASYLKQEDIDSLDYVVCTHAHEDHVGGLSGALSVADADNVWAPETEAKSRAYTNFKKKALERVDEIEHPKPGDVIKLGSSRAEVLGPVNEDKDNLNNTSIVLKITYGSTSFLFTGDAGRDEEADILKTGANLKSTVLKVGHHGSSTSTSYPFLREVMPQYAVISCEKGNSYGHPHKETLSRLNDAEVQIYRTDQNGTIVMTSDGNNVTVFTEK